MELRSGSEVIPEDLVKSFSDSVVAYDSGAVLASIVLLRAFISKFARFSIKAPNGLKTDDALAKYDESLPETIRQGSLSLRKIYNKLGSAVYTADADENLFEISKNEILNHCNALEIYALQGQEIVKCNSKNL